MPGKDFARLFENCIAKSGAWRKRLLAQSERERRRVHVPAARVQPHAGDLIPIPFSPDRIVGRANLRVISPLRIDRFPTERVTSASRMPPRHLDGRPISPDRWFISRGLRGKVIRCAPHFGSQRPKICRDGACRAHSR